MGREDREIASMGCTGNPCSRMPESTSTVWSAFGEGEKRGLDFVRCCKLISFQFLFRDGTGCSSCLRNTVLCSFARSYPCDACPIRCKESTGITVGLKDVAHLRKKSVGQRVEKNKTSSWSNI